MSNTENRPYQKKVVNQIVKAVKDGHKKIMVVAPTGSGKTKMISLALKRIGQPTAAFAHRVEICRQIEEEFLSTGPGTFSVAGVMSHSVPKLVSSDVYQSVFIDEAHHIPARSYRRIIENIEDKLLIAATATPYRSDFVSVSSMFDKVIHAPNVEELTKAGYLAEVNYVSSDSVDFNGIKIDKIREFEEEDSLRRVRVAVQAGDIVTGWRKYARGKNALIYAINVEHGEQITAELKESNIDCALITGKTGKRDRRRAIDDFQSNRIRAIVNCQVFTEGTDLTNVGAVIMVRPTMSRTLYKQMIGRGMRPDVSCVVIDHVGNYLRHGNILEEDTQEIMDKGKIASVKESYTRRMSVDVEMMDLHVEKIDDGMKRIWSPVIFGGQHG